MKILSGLNLEEIQKITDELGASKFRARQIHNWIYLKSVKTIDEMTDLSVKFREQLKQVATVSDTKIKIKQESSDGTLKYLLQYPDGECVETVLMRFDNRANLTACVSSQVGCPDLFTKCCKISLQRTASDNSDASCKKAANTTDAKIDDTLCKLPGTHDNLLDLGYCNYSSCCTKRNDKDADKLHNPQENKEIAVFLAIRLHAFRRKEDGKHEHKIIDDGGAYHDCVVISTYVGLIKTNKIEHIKENRQ